LNKIDPFWPQFKSDLLNRFNSDSKNPVDEFKRIQQLGKNDDYIHSYEIIRARILSNQYTIEEFYLFVFLANSPFTNFETVTYQGAATDIGAGAGAASGAGAEVER
jgi:hypothetical protein